MSEKPSEWVVRAVTVVTSKGSVTMEGIEHPKAPGLAVTPSVDLFGHFVVTHVASGRRIAGPYERAANAQRVLASLSRCADWTQDGAALKQQIEEHGDESSGLGCCSSRGEVRPMSKRELVDTERLPMFGGDEFPWEDEHPVGVANRILNDPGFNPEAAQIDQWRKLTPATGKRAGAPGEKE